MDDKTKKTAGWAVVVVAMVIATFLGVRFPMPEAPVEEPAGAAIRPVQFRSVNVAQDMSVGGALAVTGNTTIGGAVDIAGNPSYGALDLRPVGNPANGKILEFGATGAITVTAMTPVAITTVTAFGCNVRSPSAAAQVCGASLSGKTLTFTIYNSAVTPVAISTPHSTGASYWIAGN